MPGSLTIRDAGPDDAERIAAIHVASWQATYRGLMPDAYFDSLTIEQRLPMWEYILGADSADVQVWVAAIDDELVGFCSAGPLLSHAGDQDDSLVLHTIYLQPGYERRGIGGALLGYAEREMARLGATSATLWVLADNHGARRFYEASGWTTDGAEQCDEIFGQTVREVRYGKRLA